MILNRHQNFTNDFFDYLMETSDLTYLYELNTDELKDEITKALTRKCDQDGYTLLHHESREIVREIFNNISGLGPLEPLLADSEITDILVNGYDEVYIEKNGALKKTTTQFHSNSHVLRVCQRIVNKLSGRSIDESQPIADARLKDGSRVNIIIDPVSLKGPCISIRKFSSTFISLEVMAKNKNLSTDMVDFLRLIAECRLNILVSGGTGAGKTTLLSALTESIGDEQRIITVEDAAELKIKCPHVVSLESRPANTENRGEVTIRDLVRNALRMRPDRIIVGECRGKEAFDMLQAMNTGHSGSMSTLHANDGPEALGRLENMILMANLGLPSSAIRGFIGDAIDIIIQIERMRDNKRRISKIYEIGRFNGNQIETNILFEFQQDTKPGKELSGHFSCLNAPRFVEKKIELAGKKSHLTKIFQTIDVKK